MSAVRKLEQFTETLNDYRDAVSRNTYRTGAEIEAMRKQLLDAYKTAITSTAEGG